MRHSIVLLATVVLGSLVWGQTTSTSNGTPAQQDSMGGMDMSHHDMSNMKDSAAGGDKEDADASAHVMHSMEGHMNVGPHMKMTALRQTKAGDAERAHQVAEAARKAAERYTDYHVALTEGFQIFHPEIPQKMYHFTDYGNGLEAAFHFNPDHPTSLLYEKHGDDYKLIGVMYTAPKRFTEDQLDERIPLSVAQWHEHVNFCAPPADKRKEMLQPHAQFGLRGSITTKEACDVAGGTFRPVIFNWMVHLYPFEKDAAKIWSVERQHGDAD